MANSLKIGFLFDLDGVLVTTDDCHYSAWKQLADEENIYFDEAINNRLRGVSRMASLEIVLERERPGIHFNLFEGNEEETRCFGKLTFLPRRDCPTSLERKRSRTPPTSVFRRI